MASTPTPRPAPPQSVVTSLLRSRIRGLALPLSLAMAWSGCGDINVVAGVDAKPEIAAEVSGDVAEDSAAEVTPEVAIEVSPEVGPDIDDAEVTPDTQDAEVTPDVPDTLDAEDAEVTPDTEDAVVTPDTQDAEVTPDVPDAEVDAGPPTCDPTHTCAPPLPAGWSGPAIIAFDDPNTAPATCLGNWPSQEALGMVGLVEGDADCDCSCADPTGHSCKGTVTLRDQSSCAALPLLENQWTLSQSTCNNIGNQKSNYYTVNSSDLSYSKGSCQSIADEDFEESSFNNSARVCGGTTPAGACGMQGTGTCVPVPPPVFEGGLCVVTPGDVDCPAGPYSVRHVVADGYADNRSCGCSCDSSTGTCSASVNLFGGSTCLAIPVEKLSDTMCELETASHNRATVSTTPNGECQASFTGVGGSVDLTGSVTACCLPPTR